MLDHLSVVTCNILLWQAGYGDLWGGDAGRLHGQAGQRMDDDVGGDGRVVCGHELAAGVRDQAGVHVQGLGEQAALLEGLLEEGRVDLQREQPPQVRVAEKISKQGFFIYLFFQ